MRCGCFEALDCKYKKVRPSIFPFTVLQKDRSNHDEAFGK